MVSRHLWDDGHGRAKRVEAYGTNVMAIKLDGPRLNLNKAEEDAKEAALAGSGPTDNANMAACCNCECQAPEHEA